MQQIRAAITAGLIMVAVATTVHAQATFVVVRHAERADAGAPVSDPDLSAAGHARAASLATMLRDAKVTAIYVTPLKRTQQTAAPVAKALGLTPIVLPAADTATLIAALQQHQGTALVIGHSNTVPDIVKALSGAAVTVRETDFDHLFVVSRPLVGSASVLQLHYQ